LLSRITFEKNSLSTVYDAASLFKKLYK